MATYTADRGLPVDHSNREQQPISLPTGRTLRWAYNWAFVSPWHRRTEALENLPDLEGAGEGDLPLFFTLGANAALVIRVTETGKALVIG